MCALLNMGDKSENNLWFRDNELRVYNNRIKNDNM